MTLDPKKLATQLRRDAKRFARDYRDPQDGEYQCVVDIDVATLRLVAAVIEKGDLKRACRLAEKLDSAVRDEISDVVWDGLRGAAPQVRAERDS